MMRKAKNKMTILRKDCFKNLRLTGLHMLGVLSVLCMQTVNSMENVELPIWLDRNENAESKVAALRAMGDDSPWLEQLDVFDPSGYTGLMMAAAAGEVELARLLIEKGADMTLQSRHPEQDTALHVAVMYSDSDESREVAKLLIEKGVDVNITNRIGDRPIHSVLSVKDIDQRMKVTELLMDNFADINAQNFQGDTMLHHSVSANAIEWIRMILNKYSNIVDLEVKNRDGLTPIELAAAQEQTDTTDSVYAALQEPLDRMGGGFFGYRDVAEDGTTALMYAVARNELKTAIDFIERGAGVNAINDAGNTALHFAMRSNDPIQFLKLLLDKGADPNIADKEFGYTPLHLVTYIETPSQRKEAAHLLVEHGAHINARDNQGETLLHRAIQAEDINLVSYIVEQLPLIARTAEGQTAYDIASKMEAVADTDEERQIFIEMKKILQKE